MTPIAAYLRCSGLGNGTDTWERQLEAIRAFCKAQGYALAEEHIYREDAVPGKLDRESRPEFQRMMADLTANGCRTIVIERLDRLARRYRTQESLITYLASEGMTLFAADTGENVTEAMMGDPMRRALVQIQGIFAELDKNMTIVKLRKARERIRATGEKCEGRKAFGIRPEESKALGIIYHFHARRAGTQWIADYLNQNNIRTRYGKRWHAATVSKILARHEKETQTASLSA